MSKKETATVLLLGDSMLNNTAYVAPNKSVPAFLDSRSAEIKQKIHVHNFAQDGATISDVFSQLDTIKNISYYSENESDEESKEEKPNPFNTSRTYIILSAGGNNLVKAMRYGLDDDIVQNMSMQYADLVRNVRKSFPKAKLVSLNVYYPYSDDYAEARPYIRRWNDSLALLRPGGKLDHIIPVDTMLTQTRDLVYDIEPSAHGGRKICDAILEYIRL